MSESIEELKARLSFYEQKQCEEAVDNGYTTWREIRDATDAEILTEDEEALAFAAYSIADAMIKARKGSK